MRRSGTHERRPLGGSKLLPPGAPGASSVPTVSPLTILGSLAWWFRADQGVTIATGVSQWNDLSGNGRNLLQGTGGSQPTVQAAALNGRDAIRGDGVDDVMSVAWTRSGPSVQPFYIWLVMRQLAGWTVNDFIMSDLNVGATAGFALRQRTGTPEVRMQNLTLVNANSGGTINSFFRVEAQFSNTITDYLKIGATNTTGANAGNTAGGGTLSLFGNVDLGAPANVDIVEAFGFLGSPDVVQRALLDTYATALYGAGLV